MDKNILEFLYAFYDAGDYTSHHSLKKILDHLPNDTWVNQNAINAIRSSIARLKERKLIDLDHDNLFIASWGELKYDEPFDYVNNQIMAVLTEDGAKRIRQERVENSVIKTNNNSTKIAWLALVVATIGLVVAVLQYYKKTSIILGDKLQLQPDTLSIRIQKPPSETTYLLNLPVRYDSLKKK